MPVRGRLLLVLATAVSFLSAFLLFVIQPLFAKRLLPLMGGSPAVWTTLMMCFQLLLLGGYAYSHLGSKLSARAQGILHVLLLGISLAVLRVGQESFLPTDGIGPTAWVTLVTLICLGPAFLVLSGTAPIVQRTASLAVKDPYPLYAASNIGSLSALLIYPFYLERTWAVPAQVFGWKAGAVLLTTLLVACLAMMGRRAPAMQEKDTPEEEPPTRRRFARWVFLGMVPCTLSLGITTYITTDIASAPLFWTVPLAIYLLTFVLAFSSRKRIPEVWWARGAVSAVLLAAFLVVSQTKIWIFFPLHLLVLFLVGRVAHGELARTRPGVGHLTAFYLAMSLGGAMGGIMSALVAPYLFSAGMEYLIGLLMAAFVLPGAMRRGKVRLAVAVFVGVLSLILFHLLPDVPAVVYVLLGVCGMILGTSGEERGYGLDAVLIILAFGFVGLQGVRGDVLAEGRNFFGSFQVVDQQDVRLFAHGTTLHGMQFRDPAREKEPLSYYVPNGPAGEYMDVLLTGPGRRRVALVGLGAGGMLCFGEGRMDWTIVEIDPAVVDVALNPDLFTYHSRCAPEAPVEVADGRIAIGRAEGLFDMIIMDAFSSDAVPVHLMTREAVQGYLSRLAPDGMLVFNISNRYLDLAPVLARIAREEGLFALLGTGPRKGELPKYGNYSRWVVMVRNPETLASLQESELWKVPRVVPGIHSWTDDYSNVLSALRPRSSWD